jgi:hypothetical protein
MNRFVTSALAMTMLIAGCLGDGAVKAGVDDGEAIADNDETVQVPLPQTESATRNTTHNGVWFGDTFAGETNLNFNDNCIAFEVSPEVALSDLRAWAEYSGSLDYAEDWTLEAYLWDSRLHASVHGALPLELQLSSEEIANATTGHVSVWVHPSPAVPMPFLEERASLTVQWTRLGNQSVALDPGPTMCL